jgi:acetyl esterase
MALHPILQRMLTLAYRNDFASLHTKDLATVRATLLRNLTTKAVNFESYALPQLAPFRLYRPPGSGPHPAVFFIRGSAYIGGDLDIFNEYCEYLSLELEAAIISIDYRLAPEHRFPQGFNDCLTTLQWLLSYGHHVGLNRYKIALWGESAGGNIAAGIAQALAGHQVSLVHHTLIYPMVDFYFSYPSKTLYQQGYLLDHTFMQWLKNNYISTEHELSDYRVSPALNPQLKQLPPTTIVTAEYDPLRDEAESYAQKLQQQQVPVHCQRIEGMIHGFFMYYKKIKPAKQALLAACQQLAPYLHTP